MLQRFADFHEPGNQREMVKDTVCIPGKQQAILIGDGGARIKEIGRRAREELTRLLERRVHLFLNVKERPGWDEERARLRAIGLHEEEG